MALQVVALTQLVPAAREYLLLETLAGLVPPMAVGAAAAGLQ
jgi:hypothetical protein